jgi:hypothetical protein
MPGNGLPQPARRGAIMLKVKGNSCPAEKTKRVGITNLENATSLPHIPLAVL